MSDSSPALTTGAIDYSQLEAAYKEAAQFEIEPQFPVWSDQPSERVVAVYRAHVPVCPADGDVGKKWAYVAQWRGIYCASCHVFLGSDHPAFAHLWPEKYIGTV